MSLVVTVYGTKVLLRGAMHYHGNIIYRIDVVSFAGIALTS